jgi:acyl-CoA thioesterase FadM
LPPKPGQPWFGSGRTPSGAEINSTGRLHAEQHFEYHRPLKAGEVLTVVARDGESWEKESKRGGKLLFEEKFIEYMTADTGERVVTARFVTVLPEQAVKQEG